MIVDVLTLFPGFFESPLRETILGRATGRGLVEIRLRDIRAYATDKHARTDDVPFGGGAGMVMKPEPVVAAIEASRADGASRVILLDPSGRRFDQAYAERLAAEAQTTAAGNRPASGLALVCGRYEGFDERIRDFVDETLSVGDVVLSGGEPAALVVIDAVARLLEGVLGNVESPAEESFGGPSRLLEAPRYTRPREFRGRGVPEVLTSGDHEAIRRWRRLESLRRTVALRPDLVEAAEREGLLTGADRMLLDEARKLK